MTKILNLVILALAATLCLTQPIDTTTQWFRDLPIRNGIISKGDSIVHELSGFLNLKSLESVDLENCPGMKYLDAGIDKLPTELIPYKTTDSTETASKGCTAFQPADTPNKFLAICGKTTLVVISKYNDSGSYTFGRLDLSNVNG